MKAWLARARADADRPPARPREPLHVTLAGGSCRVGSIESGIADRLVGAGLPIQPGPTGWHIAAPVDASLAALAHWLHDAGLAGSWRDELLAVVDEHDVQVAVVERGVVRALGLTTFAVHLVGLTPDGGTWVQLRSLAKATDPGMWDTMMGGQVAAGESTLTSLARETMEEAGLDITTLEPLRRAGRISVRRPVAEGWLVEHIDVFVATVPAGVVPVNRDGEVERFECLDAAALEARLAAGLFTLEAALILGALAEDGGASLRPEPVPRR